MYEQVMISVKDVSKTFTTNEGVVNALDHVNLEIHKGEIYGIIGMSGAGKSTLVRCLNFLERPTTGTVCIEQHDLSAMKEKELRALRTKIAMIFQHFNLLMQRTVLDNVCFPLEIAGVSKREARQKAAELLKIVDLEEKAKAYPSQLSGGQKQRVAIARALAMEPKILLCDEATSALDPQTTKSILALLKEINQKYGITIVVITHEMSVIQEICRHVAVLDQGKLAESGTVEELFHSPKTEAARKLILNAGSQIQQMRGKRLIRITFSGQSSFQPVIGNAVLLYKTPLNIMYADTKDINGKAEGEMILQLPEDKITADKMIAYFRQEKLGVEELENVG